MLSGPGFSESGKMLLFSSTQDERREQKLQLPCTHTHHIHALLHEHVNIIPPQSLCALLLRCASYHASPLPNLPRMATAGIQFFLVNSNGKRRQAFKAILYRADKVQCETQSTVMHSRPTLTQSTVVQFIAHQLVKTSCQLHDCLCPWCNGRSLLSLVLLCRQPTSRR